MNAMCGVLKKLQLYHESPVLIWYKAETNECWWLPPVNNHHLESVTSTNFRESTAPRHKSWGGAAADPAPPVQTPLVFTIGAGR